MSTQVLPLREDDAPHWTLLTCPLHLAGEGAFTEVRCRESARERGGEK
jgi:hypothetical protein